MSTTNNNKRKLIDLNDNTNVNNETVVNDNNISSIISTSTIINNDPLPNEIEHSIMSLENSYKNLKQNWSCSMAAILFILFVDYSEIFLKYGQLSPYDAINKILELTSDTIKLHIFDAKFHADMNITHDTIAQKKQYEIKLEMLSAILDFAFAFSHTLIWNDNTRRATTTFVNSHSNGVLKGILYPMDNNLNNIYIAYVRVLLHSNISFVVLNKKLTEDREKYFDIMTENDSKKKVSANKKEKEEEEEEEEEETETHIWNKELGEYRIK